MILHEFKIFKSFDKLPTNLVISLCFCSSHSITTEKNEKKKFMSSLYVFKTSFVRHGFRMNVPETSFGHFKEATLLFTGDNVE